MQNPRTVYAQAVEALNKGDWKRARALSSDLMPRIPPHAGVCFVAGVAALNLGLMPEALDHLQRSVELNPSRADYGAQFAKALATGRLMRQALAAADAASACGPSDPVTLDTLGIVYTQGNQHAKALDLFRQATGMAPGRASYRFNLATSLTFSGDIDGAERELEACIACDRRYWKAHLALSKLKRVDAGTNHIGRLQALLAEFANEDQPGMYLHLAMSKELEDLGDFEGGLRHLVTGKQKGRAGRDHDPGRDAALFEAIIRSVPGDRAPGVAGSESREPIFVIGMPRTGTTLVDRILSSHPDFASAGELQNFGVILKRATRSTTPGLIDVDTVSRTGDLPWRQVGDAYIESTRPGTGKVPRFVDKLPHNFLYAGYIASALPRAAIVCLRRNPMDTCLGNFRQLFAQNTPYYDYSFDLLDTGRYYLMFDRLMRHWRQVLPGRVLEIEYEALVDDQEGTTRALLSHCGLPWDDACMRFAENEAPVATASATQVRQPLHREALQRWKRYGSGLDELRALLAEGGIDT